MAHGPAGHLLIPVLVTTVAAGGDGTATPGVIALSVTVPQATGQGDTPDVTFLYPVRSTLRLA